MQTGYITRRLALLLPFALAACGGGGGGPEDVFAPLRYNYLPPIKLNVAAISVQSQFIPAGLPPDVSNRDPAPPIQTLETMGKDRLKAFGTTSHAVFAVTDATLIQQNDVITASFGVSLTILGDNGNQLGYVTAHVEGRHVGQTDDLPATLYQLTKSMMSKMNVEFEYQIRHHLQPYLTDNTAPATAVQQAPLAAPGAK